MYFDFLRTAGGHLFEPRSLEELQDVSKLSPIIEEEENWWIGVLREHPDAELIILIYWHCVSRIAINLKMFHRLVYITDNQDIFDQLEKEGNEVNTNQEHRYICQAQGIFVLPKMFLAILIDISAAMATSTTGKK